MNLKELKSLLSGIEWNDIEFKEAASELPKSSFETVSSFANTRGGWLVFGIRQEGASFAVAGVGNPEKVQSDFLSVLHADQKINHDVVVTEKKYAVAGKTVLAFHIAENLRTRKSVYLDGDIRRTFIRRGGGDYRAKMPDIERMLRDATTDRWDSGIFEFPLKEAFDIGSLAWYRARFNEVNQGFEPEIPDNEFLAEWGYLVKQGRNHYPTRAAIMLFGSNRAFRQMLARPTLDLQFIGARKSDDVPEMRWIDRYVSEENIVNTWRQTVTKYLFFMPKPFQGIDPHTLARQDTPPGYRVFREASINLLIHQDYGDHSRKAVIKFFQDGIHFWNPGDVFGSDEDLLEPGEKEVRNPKITAGMRRLVLCEQAGTGMRMMTKLWKELKHPAPIFKNDRGRKAFEVFLPGLDVDLGGTSKLMGPVTGEVAGEVTGEVAAEVVRLLKAMSGAMKRAEIQKALNLKHDEHVRIAYILPALKAGLIEMTVPEKPNSRFQKYRLSPKGEIFLHGLQEGK